MKLILGGHWTNPPEGWTSMPEAEVDITKRLPFEDNSVDVIFTEHVFEHLPFEGALSFLRESYRVLNSQGILRTVCPCLDKLIQFKPDEIHRHYAQVQTRHYYPNEDRMLNELGLEFTDYGFVFMMDSLMKGHNHKLIWTSKMVADVTESIGFTAVHICLPGESFVDQSTCLERIVRGVDPEFLKNKNIKSFDPETYCIEAQKP
jgi:SAM-dependent methyltransferase